MAKNLVIVESPAKAKTISRFLSKDYTVLASMGHVRDLPKSKIGIDTENDFEPVYEVSAEKKKTITALKAAMKGAATLYLATDEDREGEAIGWHLLAALGVKKSMDVKRIVFHEVTKGAILEALENPRELNQDVVDAQQARRVLDRLVGYELSPLLWKKVQYGLSAGRVQSVAVRLIVEREREIEAFKPEEYWKVIGEFKSSGEEFLAELTKFKGKKLELHNEKDANKVKEAIKGAKYEVLTVETKDVKRSPAPPFITSTLQQEAARKLGFSVKKTMSVAQGLYEGVNVGDGETGLITYMRTDSVNLSQVALKAAKEVIEKDYGKEFALSEPRFYRGRKGAQEAHEAIRPVDLHLRPSRIAKFLSKDQIRLYELIWQRTLACQMKEAILTKVGADIAAGESGYSFRATGQTVKFAGFMEVYLEGRDEGEERANDGEKFLPELSEGQKVDLKKMDYNQHFTKPPARYTEASLVKKLESEGIGRPSTYAPTIGTIISRGYVLKEAKALVPTDIARLVVDFLVEHFPEIVDVHFTAEMEEKLDDVEEGKRKWAAVIREFYTPFHKTIGVKDKSVKKEDVMKERILGKDPETGLDIVVRYGRFGAYVQVGSYTADEVKAMEVAPKRTSLPKDCSFEGVTLAEALHALILPRELGSNKEGELIVVTVGPYGPYMKVGKKNCALPEGFDPYTISLAEAIVVAAGDAERRKEMAKPIAEFGPDPVSGGEILVKNGRFGPYITDGKTNVSVGKKIDPKEVTKELAEEMLKKKREGGGRRGRR
ncbi:type I DNA topoisomerase [Candidatus Gracilibacteria bacterium]|nr:type I DNA topoisomerase [Candidatus Gracilibacteria bacterium]